MAWGAPEARAPTCLRSCAAGATLMGAALVISGGLTVAYTRAASKILLILTLIGAAVTLVIGVLLFFGLA